MHEYRYSMDCSKDTIELVRQAQLGSKESLEALAERFRGRLFAYVYRIVVDKDFAQDIVQESMLQMLRVINKLERADRFWPWLRAIAFNRIRRAYNEGKSRKMRIIEGKAQRQAENGQNEGGLAKLVAEELRQAVVGTIRELKPQHRRILAMRCYEEMEYCDIAELTGCSELGARVRFCRAKRALRKRLSSKGFGRGFLVTALVIFGKLTAPSKAAAASVSVTSATMNAGVLAGLLSLAGTKMGVVSLLAGGALSVGTAVVTNGGSEVGGIEAMLGNMQVGQTVTEAAKGAEESWYYYPVGKEGPVMMRTVRWESEAAESYNQLWQDAEADYFYDQKKNTIYICNSRMWGRGSAVQRLPTDGAPLREFICRVEGGGDDMEYVSGDGRGLLVIARRGGPGSEGVKVVYHRNMMNEEYFRYKWPLTAKVVDKRDLMHKRGRAYFQISGEIGGVPVSGRGRLPFVYAASLGYYPWLEVEVGEKFRIVDGESEAVVYSGRGEDVAARYAGGSFFEGLGRPWMGLHTIDTVRRDAAARGMWFETEQPGADKVRITLKGEQVKLVYTIDIEGDVIDKIEFSRDDGAGGELRFSYFQEIGETGGEFASPRQTSSGRRPQMRLGGLWLLKLGDEKW